jgi:hypothetical protein
MKLSCLLLLFVSVSAHASSVVLASAPGSSSSRIALPPRSDGPRAVTTPPPAPTVSPACAPASPPVTQVVVVNGPVFGNVFVVQSNGTQPARPLVLGSTTTIAGHPTVEPVILPDGRVLVRRW